MIKLFGENKATNNTLKKLNDDVVFFIDNNNDFVGFTATDGPQNLVKESFLLKSSKSLSFSLFDESMDSKKI